MHQVRYPTLSSGSNSYRKTLPAPVPSPMFGNSSPSANYGYSGETRNYVHKQYPNTLYRPVLR